MRVYWNGTFVDITPQIDFEEDNDGIGIIKNENGEELGEVNIRGWNDSEPYIKNPLYFIEVNKNVSVQKRMELIRRFELWYGDTMNDVSEWAVEFELIVRMLVYTECDIALPINPQFLNLTDECWVELYGIIERVEMTDIAMLDSLLSKYKPKTPMIVYNEEIALIKKELHLAGRSVIGLRNMRNLTVLYLSTLETVNKVDIYDKMSAITHVIDTMLIEAGEEI